MNNIDSAKDSDAFIGISLDSKFFTREWIRYAIKYITARHNSLLFILADELLKYTRTVSTTNEIVYAKYEDTLNTINGRKLEFEKFLNSEIKLLDTNVQKRIIIKSWSSYSDRYFVQILRNLVIAYSSIPPFSKCVNKVASEHIFSNLEMSFSENFNTNVLYLLDEIAMCLRISELTNFYYEYYPSQQIEILEQLYMDKFAQYGLTVESLSYIEKKKRKFNILSINE